MINSDHLPFWKLLKSQLFLIDFNSCDTSLYSSQWNTHACFLPISLAAEHSCNKWHPKNDVQLWKFLTACAHALDVPLVLVAMSRSVVSTERDPAIALRPCVAPLPLIVHGDDGEGSPSRTALTWIAQLTPVTKGYCTAAVLHSDQCNC